MIVRRAALTDEVKRALSPSCDRSNCDWEEIEGWIKANEAAVWQIGADAFAITLANVDNEIEILLGGGRNAMRHTRPFLTAMENLPIHQGYTLRIEGRRGWKRFCPDWNCEDAGNGGVILTKRV